MLNFKSLGEVTQQKLSYSADAGACVHCAMHGSLSYCSLVSQVTHSKLEKNQQMLLKITIPMLAPLLFSSKQHNTAGAEQHLHVEGLGRGVLKQCCHITGKLQSDFDTVIGGSVQQENYDLQG